MPNTQPVEPESIVPLATSVEDVLQRVVDQRRSGVRGALVTVVARHGSAPSSPGQKLYLGADGNAFGTVGGGAVEREVLAVLLRVIRDSAREPFLQSFKLGPELGMCCGGQVDVLFEPIIPAREVFIVGGGHIATALAPLLLNLGFATTVCDERDPWSNAERWPGIRCLTLPFDEAGQELSREAAVLVMTHDHALDQRAIEWALRSQFAFVGGVGSRAKAERTKARLQQKDFSEADRNRIRMPIGLAIGARSPTEIAVAIAAELISWRAADPGNVKPSARVQVDKR